MSLIKAIDVIKNYLDPLSQNRLHMLRFQSHYSSHKQ